MFGSLHCQLSASGYELRVRACSTQPVGTIRELVSELSESVANAIVCWIWSATL